MSVHIICLQQIRCDAACRMGLSVVADPCQYSFTFRLSNNLLLKLSLQIPPHLKRVATLSREISGTFPTHSGQWQKFFCTSLYVRNWLSLAVHRPRDVAEVIGRDA